MTKTPEVLDSLDLDTGLRLTKTRDGVEVYDPIGDPAEYGWVHDQDVEQAGSLGTELDAHPFTLCASEAVQAFNWLRGAK